MCIKYQEDNKIGLVAWEGKVWQQGGKVWSNSICRSEAMIEDELRRTNDKRKDYMDFYLSHPTVSTPLFHIELSLKARFCQIYLILSSVLSSRRSIVPQAG